jgi:hypothetical protein
MGLKDFVLTLLDKKTNSLYELDMNNDNWLNNLTQLKNQDRSITNNKKKEVLDMKLKKKTNDMVELEEDMDKKTKKYEGEDKPPKKMEGEEEEEEEDMTEDIPQEQNEDYTKGKGNSSYTKRKFVKTEAELKAMNRKNSGPDSLNGIGMDNRISGSHDMDSILEKFDFLVNEVKTLKEENKELKDLKEDFVFRKEMQNARIEKEAKEMIKSLSNDFYVSEDLLQETVDFMLDPAETKNQLVIAEKLNDVIRNSGRQVDFDEDLQEDIEKELSTNDMYKDYRLKI